MAPWLKHVFLFMAVQQVAVKICLNTSALIHPSNVHCDNARAVADPRRLKHSGGEMGCAPTVVAPRMRAGHGSVHKSKT